ncbi:MAG: hypothetical protein ACRES7_09575 [Gammaproteobacteria bacterium]
MAWPAFRKAVETLAVGNATEEGGGAPIAQTGNTRLARYQALLSLESLAHCDSDLSSASALIIRAPASLVRLPLGGLPQVVLAGARSERTTNDINQEAQHNSDLEICIEPQDYDAFAPLRICVRAASLPVLEEFAAAIGIPLVGGPPAWTLISCTGSIQEYRGSLRWENDDDLNWERRDFNPSELRFMAPQPDARPMLRSMTNPVNNTRIHFYASGTRRAIVDRAWGRYLVMQDLDKRVLFYDPQRCKLALPATLLPPKLIERALVLCSGLTPRVEKLTEDALIGGSRLRVYGMVPLQIASLAAEKLGQRLVPYRFVK